MYGYSDFQGSLIALTDASGNVVEKYAYDPWGARRNVDDWTLKDTRTKWITNRGYTGHEQLDAFGIINMNGRVYDPATGMFMSPDPYVQAPKDWLNYNRYSYCMGNPFKYTDPTGNTFWFFRLIFGAVGVACDILSIIPRLIVSVFYPTEISKNAWSNWSTPYFWNEGKKLDESVFGKPNPNQNDVTGQPGSNGITYKTSKNNEYQKFANLSDMVNYMNSKSNDPGVNVEIVGYVLKDDKGNEYYYVLDWTGNTDDSSNNPNENTKVGDDRVKFDEKYLVAQIHTHPKSYYIRMGGDGVHNYDGNSYKDWEFASKHGVPVYSIGPTTVSVITSSSLAQSEADFTKIAGGTYTNSGLGNQMICTSNPFYYALTSEWLKHPKIDTAY